MYDDFLKQVIESRYDEILNQEKQGNILLFDGEHTYVQKLDDFVKQGADGMLYDLNRLPEVTVALAKNNTNVNMIERFDNDMAMAVLIRYLCSKLNKKE